MRHTTRRGATRGVRDTAGRGGARRGAARCVCAKNEFAKARRGTSRVSRAEIRRERRDDSRARFRRPSLRLSPSPPLRFALSFRSSSSSFLLLPAPTCESLPPLLRTSRLPIPESSGEPLSLSVPLFRAMFAPPQETVFSRRPLSSSRFAVLRSSFSR